MAITQKLISLKIDVDSLEQLNRYCRTTRQMRNRVINRIIREFLFEKEFLE